MLNGTGNNGAVPAGTATVADHDLGWDGLAPSVARELARPLDPALVSRRPCGDGRTRAYLEGHVAIAEANRVFGPGGWGYELAGEVTLREIEAVDPATGEASRVRAYSAPVTVTVPGAPPRTDMGFSAVVEESASGHEAAIKGAVADGMARALRSFGDRLGNGLGAGTEGAAADAADGDGDAAQALRTALEALCEMQGCPPERMREAVLDRTGAELSEASASQLAPLVAGAVERLRGMRPRDGE